MDFVRERQAAALLFYFHNRILNDPESELGTLIFELTQQSNFNTALPAFLQSFIEPILHYVEDQLETSNSILYLLNRFKLRCQ